MQLKGLIKVFTIIFILVSIYQLSFTVATKIVENKAESFASKGLTLDPPSALSGASKILYEDSVSNIFKFKKRYFLDSVQNETAYNFFWLMKYSYKDCRDRQLNLGLDLKGGMSLVLEISEEDVFKPPLSIVVLVAIIPSILDTLTVSTILFALVSGLLALFIQYNITFFAELEKASKLIGGL